MRFFIEKKEDGENRKRRGRIKQALIVLPVFLCCMLFLAGCGGITDFPEGSPETDSQELSEEEDREKAGDIFGLKEGTLYPILYRLEEEELVESRWFEAENKQIPRKYYLMTDKGQQTLAEMYQSWRQIAEGVERLMNREKNEEAGKDN